MMFCDYLIFWQRHNALPVMTKEEFNAGWNEAQKARHFASLRFISTAAGLLSKLRFLR
jgi:hypothetical protein